MIRLNEKEFTDIVRFMRETYGINLEKKQILIECRMSGELERRGFSSFGSYLDKMKEDPSGKMVEELVVRLTTNYTYFMREPEHFRLLKEKIFPEVFQKNYGAFYNIWCAGCSTGEECYTLAMLLRDYRDQGAQMPNIRITASDISEEVLRKAETAVYPARELEQLPSEWRQKYCHMENKHQFSIDRELMYNIRFVKQNLMKPVSEKYDLILCRNVMIYFDRESRKKLLRQLENTLNPGGYLLIGHAELLPGYETNLQPEYPAVYKKNRKENSHEAEESLWKKKL
ncbi:protein-glutamate O-methyltransferase CheR [Ruminococcus sp. OA3]|nr:protein-glutamate O-methyltransferase CheR [Ruminococcus sp. OA3]MCH1983017.1 protein-glutamate O-methyltransferase CheR [Ruminococcus sp. OA3]